MDSMVTAREELLAYALAYLSKQMEHNTYAANMDALLEKNSLGDDAKRNVQEALDLSLSEVDEHLDLLDRAVLTYAQHLIATDGPKVSS